jgi:hypothetical protein
MAEVTKQDPHGPILLHYYMFINGSTYNQSEPLLHELLVVDFGIDNTRCRQLILGVLEHVEKLDL